MLEDINEITLGELVNLTANDIRKLFEQIALEHDDATAVALAIKIYKAGTPPGTKEVLQESVRNEELRKNAFNELNRDNIIKLALEQDKDPVEFALEFKGIELKQNRFVDWQAPINECDIIVQPKIGRPRIDDSGLMGIADITPSAAREIYEKLEIVQINETTFEIKSTKKWAQILRDVGVTSGGQSAHVTLEKIVARANGLDNVFVIKG